MTPKQIAIYGAGGFAREVAWLIESHNDGADEWRVVCFIDDNSANHGKCLNDVPVMGLAQARETFPNAKAIGGIGSPKTRQLVVEKAAAVGFEFATLVHPRVERSRWIEIGTGTVICAGNILTTNIVLGRHVQINLDCTIGHDVIMSDYATLAPGVHISGCVHIGQRVYIGTGAVVINGTPEEPLVIGNDVVVGAGACVVRPVPAGLTVVGVPAKPINRS